MLETTPGGPYGLLGVVVQDAVFEANVLTLFHLQLKQTFTISLSQREEGPER